MKDEPGLTAVMDRYRERLDQALEQWLPGDDAASPHLAQAMRYAVLGQGKRFRVSNSLLRPPVDEGNEQDGGQKDRGDGEPFEPRPGRSIRLESGGPLEKG